MPVLNLTDLINKIDATIRIAGAGGKISASEHKSLLVDVADTLYSREAPGTAEGLVSALKDGNTDDTIRSLRQAVDTLAGQLAQAGGAAEILHFNFFSDLDTVSAVATLKGPKTVSDFYYSSNLVAVTFQVKSDASVSYTAQADVAALNSWIGNTTNVADDESLWQVYLVADFGSNQGEGSATMVF